ncbi:MAG: precorrin-2 dehydrogenase/sirohydrochlorin ferrochelatase family protein [Acidimicrobiales bacterium]
MRDSEPPLFHIALRIEGQRCLVVGGGPVGARKAASLAECGAMVTVVAPEVSQEIEALGIRIQRRPFEPADLGGCRLAVAATGIAEVDARVCEEARAAGVLVNAANDPEACEYLVPAVIRAGPVSVAVSTGGLSPYLAGWVKRQVGAVLTPEVADLAVLVGQTRAAVQARGAATDSLDWDNLVESKLWPLLSKGLRPEAEIAAAEWVEAVAGAAH